MARSASTPRLRLTLLYFLALLAATAFCAPQYTPGPMLQAVAVSSIAFACLGRIWCSVFIAGRKDATLVTDGPYARCRHPLYMLSFVGGIGLALATGSVSFVVATALVLTLLLARAARHEERRLAARHPHAYADYARSTPRWWPALSRGSLPDTLLVQPALLWKAFVDAGAFFLLYALLLAAQALRLSGITPTLVVLP